MSDKRVAGFVGGTAIGTLGGLIGLGGAEFRLPLLLGPFGFPALEAVIVNKALSLIVVTSALPFRAASVPLSAVLTSWPVILNLLAGSLVGAWLGAGAATRLPSEGLRRLIGGLLIGMAVLLFLSPESSVPGPRLLGLSQVLVGVGAGIVIGGVASLLGVAGGELLIPTLIVLFAVDIELAGSLSLAISLPTMVVGFIRYSYDQSFRVLHEHRGMVITMAMGSLFGTFLGGRLLGVVPHAILLPLLASILIISAVKLWYHRNHRPSGSVV